MLTVLLVDDEPIERKYLRRLFERQAGQYRVVGEAGDGEEAVRLALALEPDILIMDISLPLCDGLNASRRIRAALPRTVILLNTAYAEFEFARKAVSYDLDAYLLKPTGEKEILDTVAECVQRRNRPERGGQGPEPDRYAPEAAYPAGNIAEAVLIGDLRLLQNCMEQYRAFLRRQTQSPDYLRLHVINTVFAAQQALRRKKSPDKLLELCERTLLSISKADQWAELLRDFDTFSREILAELRERLGDNREQIQAVADYIDLHYQEPLTLDLLADLIHFSPSYLSHLFHQEKGVTIKAYINRRRVRQAQALLKNSDLPVNEISAACGFANISNFNRVFKQYTGDSPVNLRRRQNQSSERGRPHAAH